MKVDIDNVLRTKNPGLHRLTPRCVINYIKKIVHQDEVNSYLEDFSHLQGAEFAAACLQRMNITFRAEGIENLAAQGRYIFASNHPFGGLDGLMLAVLVSGRFGDVRLVVNDLLMNLEPLKSIFVPINKHGRQSAEYARTYNDTFESPVPIVTFPAGLCSRRYKGEVRDSRWKANFIKRAISSRRDVVPVYFEGELSRFFYRLSNFRSHLGLKANIEMLYLADEMFRQGGKEFTVIFGEPVKWEELQQYGRPVEAARMIRKKAYNLKKKG